MFIKSSLLFPFYRKYVITNKKLKKEENNFPFNLRILSLYCTCLFISFSFVFRMTDPLWRMSQRCCGQREPTSQGLDFMRFARLQNPVKSWIASRRLFRLKLPLLSSASLVLHCPLRLPWPPRPLLQLNSVLSPRCPLLASLMRAIDGLCRQSHCRLPLLPWGFFVKLGPSPKVCFAPPLSPSHLQKWWLRGGQTSLWLSKVLRALASIRCLRTSVFLACFSPEIPLFLIKIFCSNFSKLFFMHHTLEQ